MQFAGAAVLSGCSPNNQHTDTMNTAVLTKVGIALGILYAAYKFIPNASVKAGVLGVGGVIIAKQLPYVKDVV